MRFGSFTTETMTGIDQGAYRKETTYEHAALSPGFKAIDLLARRPIRGNRFSRHSLLP
jgi:hypothetical protein